VTADYIRMECFNKKNGLKDLDIWAKIWLNLIGMQETHFIPSSVRPNVQIHVISIFCLIVFLNY